jgi:hypothetical protein
VSDISSLFQTWLLPVATGLLALVTAALAYFTYKMAKSTAKALEQNARLVEETHELVESNKVLVENEERHHQERMSPLVTFEFYSEWKHNDINSLIDLTRIDDNIVYLNGSVSNKGYGISNNGSLYLLCREKDSLCIKIDLPILAPGQIWNNTKIKDMDCIEMHFIDDKFRADITNAVLHKEWLVILVVEDIYRKQHFTRIRPSQRDNSIDICFNLDVIDGNRSLCNYIR